MLRICWRSIALLLVACVAFTSALPAYAASYVVNTVSDTAQSSPCMGVAGDCSLHDAVTLANLHNADEDLITFDPTIFATPQTIVLSQSLSKTAGTLRITGPAAQVTISGNNQVVVMSVGTGATLTLSALTVANGSGNGSFGGAISNNGTLTITQCTFLDNSASRGGAIYNSGTLSVSTSSFLGNSAPQGTGGGIYNYATLAISDSTFSGNSGYSGGGGIQSDAGMLTVTNSIFSSNSARYGDGGGIGTGSYSTLTVISSTFSDNSSSDGGGIANGGPGTVTGSTFSGNSSWYIGGGLSNGGSLTVTNSTFYNNSAAAGGGGIQSEEGTVVVINSTLSGNSGGSIFPGGGGGIQVLDAVLTLENTIIANSSHGDCYRYSDSASIITAKFSLDDDGSCVTAGSNGNLTAAPLLGPLQDNGGPTQTMAITGASPAYNAGKNGLAGSDLKHDQRGAPFARKFDATVDIGAYEAQPDFSISVSPASQSVTVGGIATYTVNITPIEGFTGDVKLRVTGQPPYLHSACTPNLTTATTTCTLTTHKASLPGTYAITITGTGLGRQHSTIATLTVE